MEPMGCHEHESKSAGRGETVQFVAVDRRMRGAGGELSKERAQVVAAIAKVEAVRQRRLEAGCRLCRGEADWGFLLGV